MNIQSSPSAPITSIRPQPRPADAPETPSLPRLSDVPVHPDWSLENLIEDRSEARPDLGFGDFSPSELDFSPAAPPSDERLSAGEIRDRVEDALGENVTDGLIIAGGLANLASGGDLEFSQSTDGFMRGSEVEFEVSRDRVSVGWGVQF